jgi:hypothetical protein
VQRATAQSKTGMISVMVACSWSDCTHLFSLLFVSFARLGYFYILVMARSVVSELNPDALELGVPFCALGPSEARIECH